VGLGAYGRSGDGEGGDGWGRGASLLPISFTARALGGGTVHVSGEEHSQGLLGDGLDVRGEGGYGGYVVTPPSSTARAYRWIDRSPPAGASWLIGCLKAATSGETLF